MGQVQVGDTGRNEVLLLDETGTNVNEIMHVKRKREVEELKEKDKIFDLEKTKRIQFSRKLKMKRRRW
jgi:hypothetical protein